MEIQSIWEITGSWVVKAPPPPGGAMWVVLCCQLGETRRPPTEGSREKRSHIFVLSGDLSTAQVVRKPLQPKWRYFYKTKPSSRKEGCTLWHLVHWNEPEFRYPFSRHSSKGQEQNQQELDEESSSAATNCR